MRATTGFGFAAQPAAAAGRVELTQDELNSLRKSAVNDPRRIQYGQLPPKSKASGDNDTDEDTDPPPPPPADDVAPGEQAVSNPYGTLPMRGSTDRQAYGTLPNRSTVDVSSAKSMFILLTSNVDSLFFSYS